jgi:superfamily I DNA and RNA helicase
MAGPVSITRGTNAKPASSRALASFFADHTHHEGQLFIGYPIIGTADGRHAIDALLVSPSRGIVVFDLVEGTDPGDYRFRQDDAANKVDARLRLHPQLMHRRDLLVDVHTVSFAPAIPDIEALGDTSITNLKTLDSTLLELRWPRKDSQLYRTALSVIESISSIRQSKARRDIAKDGSRGAKLKSLEDSIATLDALQRKAVIETVDGVQRIRGLAGSGKTIVLALKAAYLHAQHPNWRIAVTFNTRSLKGQFRRLITNFALASTGDEPDWSKLRILNAWGAPGDIERDGVYHEYCLAHEVEYLDFGDARARFGRGSEFAESCTRALAQTKKPKNLYQAILVDEAQDFPPVFLRLCYQLLDSHRRLVYAYDELQNLSGESLPSPEQIFGNKPDGSPLVSFSDPAPGEPRSDIILKTCYRNSRPVLVTAHALGFGVYRKPPTTGSLGLVQMFDQPELWEDIGYKSRGELKPGARVVLWRETDTSPRFLEEHSPIEDLLQYKAFNSADEQADWVVEEIRRNLKDEELRHDDIVVINPDPLTTRQEVGPIRQRLLKQRISSHLAGVDTDPDVFFQSDSASITFTGIYRAKGNEAGMVYIINAQDCHSSRFNLATLRNRLFTAITRSKAWVRVLGIGNDMKKLADEYRRLLENDFELRFTYPTKEQREHLMIVHRDMTASEQLRRQKTNRELSRMLEELKAGTLRLEDLDPKLLREFRDTFDGMS